VHVALVVVNQFEVIGVGQMEGSKLQERCYPRKGGVVERVSRQLKVKRSVVCDVGLLETAVVVVALPELGNVVMARFPGKRNIVEVVVYPLILENVVVVVFVGHGVRGFG